MTSPPAKFAFIDETIRDPGSDPGYYQLTAALVDGVDLASIRASVVSTVPTGQVLHTSNFVAAGRAAEVHGLLQMVAASSMWTLVVVTAGHTSDQEGARQRCMADLLTHVNRNNVRFVIADSREAIVGRDPQARNKRDLATLGALRRAGGVSRFMTLTHMHDSAEPMLWVPDAAGWAFRQKELRSNATYWNYIGGLATVIRI